MKILIAGAGPTGLTAGIELARRGVQVSVIGKRSCPSNLSRAIGINPKSLKLLTPSGVTEKLLEHGIQYHFIRFCSKDRFVGTVWFRNAPIQFNRNYLLALPQEHTESILRDALLIFGGEINYDSELCNIRQNNDRVIAEMKNGKELSCDYLIGADGTRGITRETIGIDIAHSEIEGTWSTADVSTKEWPYMDSPTICMLRRGKMVAVAPIGKDRLYLISNTENAVANLPLPLNISKINREEQFKNSLRHAAAYSRGRVFLAGDSAHSQSPIGARGMNLGIADAAYLANRLYKGDLSEYSKNRSEECRRLTKGSERLRKIITTKDVITRSMILTAIKSTSILPAVQGKIASIFLYG